MQRCSDAAMQAMASQKDDLGSGYRRPFAGDESMTSFHHSDIFRYPTRYTRYTTDLSRKSKKCLVDPLLILLIPWARLISLMDVSIALSSLPAGCISLSAPAAASFGVASGSLASLASLVSPVSLVRNDRNSRQCHCGAGLLPFFPARLRSELQ